MNFNRFKIALLSTIHCAVAAPQLGVDMVNQMQERSMYSAMNLQAFPLTDANADLPPVMAYIEIFPKQGDMAMGYGMVRIKLRPSDVEFMPVKGEKKFRDPESKGPSYSYIELSGQSYLPKDTDSIRVWGLRGYPHFKRWVFLLAEGKVNAYGHYPGNFPRYFAQGKPGLSMPPDSSQVFGRDSLRNLVKTCSRAWAEARKNPILAVKIFNDASEKEITSSAPASLLHMDILRDLAPSMKRVDKILEKYPHDYLARVSRVRSLCKAKKFSEAQQDLALARNLDSAYYLLHWTQAYCEEMRADSSSQLAHLYRTNHYAPYSWDNREKAESQIKVLEKSAAKGSLYWRVPKTRKPPKPMGTAY